MFSRLKIIEYGSVDVPNPEQCLIAAVIIRAWADLGSSTYQVKRDAEKWITSRKSSSFSFIWCCDALGYSSSFVRQIILSVPFWARVNKLQEERHNKQVHCFVSHAKIFIGAL